MNARVAAGICLTAGVLLGLMGCSGAISTTSVSGTFNARMVYDPGPSSTYDATEAEVAEKVALLDCDRVIGTTYTGRQVTLRGGDGEIVGLATLVSPKIEDVVVKSYAIRKSANANCSWSFTFEDVNLNSDFYTLEIMGIDGSTNLTKTELIDGPRLTAS